MMLPFRAVEMAWWVKGLVVCKPGSTGSVPVVCLGRCHHEILPQPHEDQPSPGSYPPTSTPTVAVASGHLGAHTHTRNTKHILKWCLSFNHSPDIKFAFRSCSVAINSHFPTRGQKQSRSCFLSLESLITGFPVSLLTPCCGVCLAYGWTASISTQPLLSQCQ